MKQPRITPAAAAIAAVAAILPAPAFAAGGEATPLNLPGSTSVHHVSSSAGGSIVRTIVGLFVVIAVIYGIAWVMRQVKAGRNRPSGSTLAPVASLPLGANRSVALVRVGRELVLMGISENSVTRIRTYTEAEAAASGLDLTPDAPVDFGSSEPRLSAALERLRRMTVRP